MALTRIITLLLALAAPLTLGACGGEEAEEVEVEEENGEDEDN